MIGFVKDKKKMTIIIQKHILQYVILFENTNTVVSNEIRRGEEVKGLKMAAVKSYKHTLLIIQSVRPWK